MGSMSPDKTHSGSSASAVAAFGLLKFLLVVTNQPGWAAFVGLVLLVAIGWGAWQKVQSSGGFQMGDTGGGTMGGGTMGGGTPPSSPPPSAPPPSGGMPPSRSTTERWDAAVRLVGHVAAHQHAPPKRRAEAGPPLPFRGSLRSSATGPSERTRREEVPVLRRGDPGRRDQVSVLLQRPPGRHRYRHAATARGAAAPTDDAEDRPPPRNPRHRPCGNERDSSVVLRSRAVHALGLSATCWATLRTSSASGIGRLPVPRSSGSRGRTRAGGTPGSGSWPRAEPSPGRLGRPATRLVTGGAGERSHGRASRQTAPGARPLGRPGPPVHPFGVGLPARLRADVLRDLAADRPHRPLERFPSDDAGWAAAWRRFTAIETNYAEVGLGSSGSS